MGFHVRIVQTLRSSTRQKLRLKGLNCPEVHGVTKTAGLAAKAATEAFLKAKLITVTTFKAPKTGADAEDLYGRYLAVVYAAGQNLNEYLLANGFAVPFMADV